MKLDELDFDVIEWNEDDEIENTAQDFPEETKVIAKPGEIERAIQQSAMQANDEAAEAIAGLAEFEAQGQIQDSEAGSMEYEGDAEAEAECFEEEIAEDGDLTEEEIAELGGLEYQDEEVIVAPKVSAKVKEAKAPKAPKAPAKQKPVRLKLEKTKEDKKKPTEMKTKKAAKAEDKDEKKKGGFHFSMMDAVIAFVGVLVLLMAVVVFVFYPPMRKRGKFEATK